MAKPVTARDVARHVGVSQSAVSRAFTPGASVSEKKREIIIAAASQLGYRPNAVARSLVTQKSRIIGVVTSSLENEFYAAFTRSLSIGLQEAGYHLLLFTGYDDRDSDPIIRQSLQYQIEGLVLTDTTLSSELAEDCRRANLPIVAVNRTSRYQMISSVASRNRAGGAKVAEFLVSAGHRRLAYVAGIADSSTNRDRETGFRKAIASCGLEPPRVEIGDYTRQGSETATRRLLSADATPDAIFCANDHMAFGALDVARFEFGLRVPEDLSVIGYDNVESAAWQSYRLTTVEQPVERMANAAVDTLLAHIDYGRSTPIHRRFEPKLVVRDSCRMPP